MRVALALSLLALLAFVACKDDAKKAATTSTASARPVAKRLPNGQCPPRGSTCAYGEYEQYTSCVDAKCDDANKKCFGDGYKGGASGGACAEHMKCTAACACDDAVCMDKCAPSKDCRACLASAVLPCVQGSGCDAPSCAAPSAP